MLKNPQKFESHGPLRWLGTKINSSNATFPGPRMQKKTEIEEIDNNFNHLIQHALVDHCIARVSK